MDYPGIEEDLLRNLTQSNAEAHVFQSLNEKGIAETQAKLRKFSLLPYGAAGAPTSNIELRIVLLGKAGAGKSSTGNLIIGKNAFKSSASALACTPTIQEEHVILDGIKVRVLDTPGTFAHAVSKESIICEIAKVIDTFSEGIHVFLFVYNLGNPRYSEEQDQAIKEMEKLFGKKFIQHCVVCLTNANNLINEGLSLEDYINAESAKETPLGTLLKSKMKGRVIAVENGETLRYSREQQAKQLVHFLDHVVEEAGSIPYTNEEFQHIQREQHQAGENPGAMAHTLRTTNAVCFAALNPIIHDHVRQYVQRTPHNQLLAIHRDYINIAWDLMHMVKPETGQEGEAVLEAGLTLLISEALKSEVERVTNPSFLQRLEPFADTLLMAGAQLLEYIRNHPEQISRAMALVNWLWPYRR